MILCGMCGGSSDRVLGVEWISNTEARCAHCRQQADRISAEERTLIVQELKAAGFDLEAQYILDRRTQECPGSECPLCTGAACRKCGAGLRSPMPGDPDCDHDSVERHHDYTAVRGGMSDPGSPVLTTEDRLTDNVRRLALLLDWVPSTDDRLTCLVCGTEHCDVEAKTRDRNGTTWSGAHGKCLKLPAAQPPKPKLSERLGCHHCGIEIVGIPTLFKGGPCPGCSKPNSTWKVL